MTRVGIDIETTGLNPRTDEIVGVAYVQEGQDGIFLDVRSGAPDIDLHGGEVVGHNLAFDTSFLRQKYGVPYPSQMWDTMVVEQALTAGFDYLECNLSDVSVRYLGVGVEKSLQTTFNLEDPITDEMVEYALHDVRTSMRIAEMQRLKVQEHGLERIIDLEMSILPIFAEMVRVGVKIDLEIMLPLLEETRRRHETLSTALQEILTEHVEWERIRKRDEMQGELDAWLDKLHSYERWQEGIWNETFNDLGMVRYPTTWIENKWDDETIDKKDNKRKGMKRFVKAQVKDWRADNPRPPVPKIMTGLINLNSAQQMKTAFDHLGMPMDNMRGTTLSAAMVDSSADNRHILQMTREYKKAEKLLSSFGDALLARLDDDNCLHGNFKQYGTATGRPTCSQPNMLQIPSKKNNATFRKAFIPRDGNLFIVADYSQIELRIMAELSGDEAMLHAFKEKLDLHTYTASLMFKTPLGEVTDRQRSTAKTVNFGILYGMGPKKLRETLINDGIDMSMDEAVESVKQWKKSYLRAAGQIVNWQMSVLQLGYTATPFGRKRFFDITTEDKYERFGIQRAGANHVIQGTSADITKLAMLLIHSSLEGLPGVIVLQVYDEIVVEVPEYLAEWAKDMVQSCMHVAAEEVLNTVPCQVDAVISRSWSEEDEV